MTMKFYRIKSTWNFQLRVMIFNKKLWHKCYNRFLTNTPSFSKASTKSKHHSKQNTISMKNDLKSYSGIYDFLDSELDYTA